MAQKIAATARRQSSTSAKRIEVAPEHRPSSVSALGTTRLMDRSSNRSSRRSRRSEAHWRGVILSSRICGMFLFISDEFCQYRFAGLNALIFTHDHRRVRRQINVQPAAETDDPETLTPAHRLPLQKIALDAPRDQTSNLYHGQSAAVSLFFGFDPDGHA